jgi:hypothetical protein
MRRRKAQTRGTRRGRAIGRSGERIDCSHAGHRPRRRRQSGREPDGYYDTQERSTARAEHVQFGPVHPGVRTSDRGRVLGCHAPSTYAASPAAKVLYYERISCSAVAAVALPSRHRPQHSASGWLVPHGQGARGCPSSVPGRRAEDRRGRHVAGHAERGRWAGGSTGSPMSTTPALAPLYVVWRAGVPPGVLSRDRLCPHRSGRRHGPRTCDGATRPGRAHKGGNGQTGSPQGPDRACGDPHTGVDQVDSDIDDLDIPSDGDRRTAVLIKQNGQLQAQLLLPRTLRPDRPAPFGRTGRPQDAGDGLDWLNVEVVSDQPRTHWSAHFDRPLDHGAFARACFPAGRALRGVRTGLHESMSAAGSSPLRPRAFPPRRPSREGDRRA